MKKQLLAFAPVMLLALGGCSIRGGESSINADKTQLFVGVYTGGLESGSMYAVAEKFEKKYENYSFEDGKKGVEIVFTDGRFSDTMKDTISDGQEEVFLDTAASSTYLSNKGLLLDLSELYNSPMNKDLVTGELDASDPQTKSFYDIVRSDRRDLYRGSTDKNAFYGVPGFSQYHGIVYDVDMFEKYNLYYASNGTSFVTSATEERSKGPDGKAGTNDDGLPATFDDFFALSDKIVSLDMTPIMWAGTVPEYVSSLLTAIAADSDGKEQAELNYNYSGKAKTLITLGNDGTVKADASATDITAKNGYELYRQEGRYDALTFLERITSNKNYYNYLDATSLSFTHKDAQEQFLFSKRSKTRKRTAMLVEGTWWNQEANGTYLSMSAEYGEEDSRQNRKMGFLAFPKAKASKVGEPFTVLERAVGDGFIKANIAESKKKVALSFLQYIFKNDSCVTFLQLDGQTRAVDFSLTSDEYSSLNFWAKSMFDMKENAAAATMYSDSKIMQNYPSELWYSANVWKSNINGTTYVYPSTAMINSHVTAASYFEGGSAYWTESTWSNKFQNV